MIGHAETHPPAGWHGIRGAGATTGGRPYRNDNGIRLVLRRVLRASRQCGVFALANARRDGVVDPVCDTAAQDPDRRQLLRLTQLGLEGLLLGRHALAFGDAEALMLAHLVGSPFNCSKAGKTACDSQRKTG